MSDDRRVMSELEHVPEGEALAIANIVRLTRERLEERYHGKPAIRRGVHPKDHGCVTATFTVAESLSNELRVGVFSIPGHRYSALVRFSNAEVNADKADSGTEGGVVIHGSRGMAVKLLEVTGSPLMASNLMTTHGPVYQDFLMINQPVFAFANVEDYEALSEVLLRHKDIPTRFFDRLKSPDTAVRERAAMTGAIIKRITSHTCPPAFQPPPANPLDNRYFSAAPFLFGEGRAMKFGARPVSPASESASDFADASYLRAGLNKRLTQGDGQETVFEFQVQVRSAAELSGKIESDIENACVEWKEDDHPFVTVATITIPPQNIEDPARKALCEDLVFSPWQGLVDHRPLGGINRLRLAVYEESVRLRHMPQPPAPGRLDAAGVAETQFAEGSP
jgi:hypothetical protein